MRIWIYRDVNSDSARELVKALNGTRLRDASVDRRKSKFTANFHRVVCWGKHLPNLGHIDPKFILNGSVPIRSKYEDTVILHKAGIPTVEVAKVRFQWEEGEWLPRAAHHVGGDDLLNPTQTVPAYFSRKEDLEYEYRVHIFRGESIRAGVKIPRETYRNQDGSEREPHPWIRSWDSGWRISYTGVKKPVRELAKSAITALGLDFGAVDIGQRRQDKSVLVLEVNRAPGVESGTIDAYVDAIKRWANGLPPKGEAEKVEGVAA
jgi:hypothetical protein